MNQLILKYQKGNLTKLAAGTLTLVTLISVGSIHQSFAQPTPTKTTAAKAATISVPTKKVVLKGRFIQNLEQSDFNDGKTTYHLYDPQGLLAKKGLSLGQKGVSLNFKTCIEGRVSEKGTYGHLGKQPYEVWVDKICQ